MYKFNKKTFMLKDLTLDESDEVNNILKGSNAGVELDNKATKAFLRIVLEPTPNDDDLSKCTETIALEVLKDFFSLRLKRGKNMTDYFKSLLKDTKKH